MPHLLSWYLHLLHFIDLMVETMAYLSVTGPDMYQRCIVTSEQVNKDGWREGGRVGWMDGWMDG